MEDKDKLLSDIGRTIRHFREESNLSQEELAHICNLDRTYIGGVERGERNLTIKSLEKIVHALDISFLEFFKNMER